MSGISGSYNAMSWLLDRNIDEGRADKLAFTDTASELTYGELQKQSCRLANMLRRLGVRREERVAMIMLDTVDFPVVFLGAIRAGVVPVPLNTLLTSDQYAYVLADCRARVLFISEAMLPVVKDMLGRMPDLDHVIISGKVALMNRYNPTIFFGVPTLFSAMLNEEALKHERLGSRLRICTSAGEPLPESVGNAWKARFGVDILDGVGSTELLHIFLSNAPGDIKYGSSGRPVPGYKVRLVNEEGEDVPDGEVGELLVQAPSAAEGYWNQRSKTRQTFQGHWTYTGDKYTRDA